LLLALLVLLAGPDASIGFVLAGLVLALAAAVGVRQRRKPGQA
jgi:LPXTG-motif cell wall-anchored protein